jgi:hypothetical protein
MCVAILNPLGSAQWSVLGRLSQTEQRLDIDCSCMHPPLINSMYLYYILSVVCAGGMHFTHSILFCSSSYLPISRIRSDKQMTGLIPTHVGSRPRNVHIWFVLVCISILSFLPSVTATGIFASKHGYKVSSPVSIEGMDIHSTLMSLSNKLDQVTAQLSNVTAELKNSSARLAIAETEIVELRRSIFSVDNRVDGMNNRLLNAEILQPGTSTLVDTILSLESFNGTGSGAGIPQILSLLRSNASINMRISNVEQSIQEANITNGIQLHSLEARIGAVEQLTPDSSPIVITVNANNAALSLQGPSALVSTVNNTSSIIASAITSTMNRISNGLFMDSTNGGALFSPVADNTIVANSWQVNYHGPPAFDNSFAAQINMNNVSTTLAGVNSYLGISTLNAIPSLNPGDFVLLMQVINWGQILDLNWGTSDARPVTLSFSVKSRQPGAFGGSIRNSSPVTRSFPFKYVIHVADIWQTVTVLVPGDRIGNWNKASPNTPALTVVFSILCGTTYSAPLTSTNTWVNGNYHTVANQSNFATNAGNYIYISAVQLFNTVSSFNYRRFHDPQLFSMSSELNNIRQSTPAFRNRIQNGDFAQDSTNEGAPIPILADAQRFIDHWITGCTTLCQGNFTLQQNLLGISPPVPFASFLGVNATGTFMPLQGANEYFLIQQRVPLASIIDLGWGTPSASPVTVSFWVRSSQSGSYSILIRNKDLDRTQGQSYVITSENVWQFISLTFSGETSGRWPSHPNLPFALYLFFTLSDGEQLAASSIEVGTWVSANRRSVAGSTRLTPGQNWMITGVQLEKGTIPSAFDKQPTEITDAINTLTSTTMAYKNRISNGDMQLDSMNKGAPIMSNSTDTVSIPLIDGWKFSAAGSSINWVIQRNLGSVQPPNGALFYLGAQAMNANSTVGSSQFALIEQAIPFGAMADLQWSTIDASPVTISFHIRVSQAGVYTVAVRNSTGINQRNIIPFVVSQPNVWQKMSFTIFGSSSPLPWGSISDPNAPALSITFALQAGSKYLLNGPTNTFIWGNTANQQMSGPAPMNIATISGSTFMITLVQLEKGNVATIFDSRPYNTELFPLNGLKNLLQMTPAYKNRVLNGDMSLDTLNHGNAVPVSASTVYIADNFFIGQTVNGTTSPNSLISQLNMDAVAPPVGNGYSQLKNYVGVKVINPYTPLVNADWTTLSQYIELPSTADFGFGTLDASPVSISFWVRSNVIGQFGGSLRNLGILRVCVFPYTIRIADTWQYISVTLPGDVNNNWLLATQRTTLILALADGGSASIPISQSLQWMNGNKHTVTGQANLLAAVGNYFSLTGQISATCLHTYKYVSFCIILNENAML